MIEVLDISDQWAPIIPLGELQKLHPILKHKVVWCEPFVQPLFRLFACEGSGRSDISYFWDTHHSHTCSFNKVWVKCIHSLSVLRCYVSIYAFTWCNHGCIHLVLVFFPMKEFGNLALMVTLAKLAFGALSMALKPSTMQPINLDVFWFCVMVSPCWTTNVQKASIWAKKSLDDFSTFGPFSFHFSRDLSTIGHSRTYCPLFFLSTHSEGKSWNAHPHSIEKTSESRCAQGIPLLVRKLFPSHYSFWELQKFSWWTHIHVILSFFSSNMGNNFSWALALLRPSSSFLVFFLFFRGGVFVASSTKFFKNLSFFILKFIANHGLT